MSAQLDVGRGQPPLSRIPPTFIAAGGAGGLGTKFEPCALPASGGFDTDCSAAASTVAKLDSIGLDGLDGLGQHVAQRQLVANRNTPPRLVIWRSIDVCAEVPGPARDRGLKAS
jgi:hypothetical protein